MADSAFFALEGTSGILLGHFRKSGEYRLQMLKSLFEKVRGFLWHEKSDKFARILWLLLALFMAVLAFFRPAKRTVCYHYSNATYNWWFVKPNARCI